MVSGRFGFGIEVKDSGLYARVMKRVWLIVILAFGVLCALPWTGDPRVALTDWSAPYGINSYIELAARVAPWKRSALGLGCGSDHQLRLVLRSRLPGPRWVLRPGSKDKATIFIRDIAHSLEVPITLTATGAVDTLVTEPLSSPTIRSLATFFGSAAPQRVDVVTMETGTFMRGRANSAAILQMVSACKFTVADGRFRAVP